MNITQINDQFINDKYLIRLCSDKCTNEKQSQLEAIVKLTAMM